MTPYVHHRVGRYTARRFAACLVSVLLIVSALVRPAKAPAKATPSRPTIVLAHGAFADGSSWSRVVGRLQRDGYTVLVPSIPLRGVASDAA